MHNRDISPAAAVVVDSRGLSQQEHLTAPRPEAESPFGLEPDRILQRPQLDIVIAQTGLGLTWDAENGDYRFADSKLGLQFLHPAHPASPPRCPPTPHTAGCADGHTSIRLPLLPILIAERGFLAIGVPIPADRPRRVRPGSLEASHRPTTGRCTTSPPG